MFFLTLLYYKTMKENLKKNRAMENISGDISKCPFHNGKMESVNHGGSGTSNKDWWPKQLTLDVLRQHSPVATPYNASFNYQNEFNSLDYDALKNDLRT